MLATPPENSCLVWADLFDMLSIALAYPDQNFYQALKKGSFNHDLQQITLELQQQHWDQALAQLAVGVGQVVPAGPSLLESQYVALFDADLGSNPVHLNGRLYQSGGQDPVRYLQSLQKTHVRYGIETKTHGNTEQVDHLSLQLEFLSYLLRRAVPRNPAVHEEGAYYLQGGREFLQQLLWVNEFQHAFQQTHQHPFYSPLIELAVTCILSGKDNI